jgi:spindle assembly abnormal protein 6
MRETIFTGKIPITCPNEDIPWQMKCDMVHTDDKIEIRLIDTRDIFTFYLCTISSGDFYVMKREQDIIVDYDRFVAVLVKLFHGLTTGKLTAMFSQETNRFLFVEKDEFRNIVRLELKFFKPDESHYKMYLGDIIGRMESDNIKLIKENGMLRDKVRGGEKDLRDKIRYLEEELGSSQRKSKALYEENERLASREGSVATELNNLTVRTHELEKENARLSYECDKLKLQEVKNAGLSEKSEALERENKMLRDELTTANEIIRKYTEEAEKAKASAADNEEAVRELRSEGKRHKSEQEESRSRIKTLEERNKKLKEEAKSKDARIKELETENLGLVKKLENAQNVYSHFYNKSVKSPPIGNYSDNESAFSIHPESPPH